MYYAGCNVTGTDGVNVSVTAAGKDITSGIDSWYCYNSNSNSWESCLNSSLCSTYKISGWNGYTKIKVKDKAGNESNEATLYKTKSAKYNGTGLTSSSVSLTKILSNVISVYSKTATQGAINSISYNKDGTINITGTATGDTTTTTEDAYYTLASISPLYSYGCPNGGSMYEIDSVEGKNIIFKDANNIEHKNLTNTIFFKDENNKITSRDIEKSDKGQKICIANSYRLQNETCTCTFVLNDDKTVNPAEYWEGQCLRDETYCNDQYNSELGAEELFDIITNRNKPSTDNFSYEYNYSDTASFYRPDNSTCFTYYKNMEKVFDKNTATDYLGYREYVNKHLTEKTNNRFKPLPINQNIKTLMNNASNSTEIICGKNDNGVVENDEYYSSHSPYNNENGLCYFLGEKYNNSKSEIYHFELSYDNNKMLLIPYISSASCQYRPGFATKIYEQVPNTCVKDEENNKVYCCSDSNITPTLVNGTYQCKTTTTVTITKFKYDYTINYYTK